MNLKALSLTVSSLALSSIATAAAQVDVTVRGFGGIVFGGDLDYDVDDDFGTITDFDIDTGFVVGGAAGVSWSDFTFEIEGAFRSQSIQYGYDITDPDFAEFANVVADFDAEVGSVLANAWYEYDFTEKFSVYGGGGIGVGFSRFSLNDFEGLDLVPDGFEVGDPDDLTVTGTSFAWQIGAGVKYSLSENVAIGAGYRFFNSDIGGGSFVDGDEIEQTNAIDFSNSSLIAEITYKF